MALWEHEQWVNPKLAAPPSHYATSQCFVTLGADRAPLLTREITGIDSLLWASDYPHPEGTFPESQAVVERTEANGSRDHLILLVDDVEDLLALVRVECAVGNEQGMMWSADGHADASKIPGGERLILVGEDAAQP